MKTSQAKIQGEGDQCKNGKASPNGFHRAHHQNRDSEKEDRKVETVLRLQKDQRELCKG